MIAIGAAAKSIIDAILNNDGFIVDGFDTDVIYTRKVLVTQDRWSVFYLEEKPDPYGTPAYIANGIRLVNGIPIRNFGDEFTVDCHWFH
jgi:hypothetical protein